MQYCVVPILIVIRLFDQVAGQSGPTSSLTSTPSKRNPDPQNPSSTTSYPNNPSSTTPNPYEQSCPSGDTFPIGIPPSDTPSSGTHSNGTPSSGGGTDNLPCIKNILQLCEDYQFIFNEVSDQYGCTMFANPYIIAFYGNLMDAYTECDTIMELEVMRQSVMTNKGQPGASTHAF